ncbi:MAG: hypothetical protein ACXVIY_00960 [Mucilaginibacter sp.]
MAKTVKPEENNNPEVISLADVLSRHVEPPAGGHYFEMDEEIPITDHIELEQEPETTYQQEPNDPEPSGDIGDSLSADDLSVIMVNMLDGLQRFGFAAIRKKVKFSEEELEIVGNLDMSAKIIYPEGSKEAIAAAKWRKHLQTLGKLPFEKDEKGRLIAATTIYARTVNLKVSPLTGLLMAYTEVLGTRIGLVFED